MRTVDPEHWVVETKRTRLVPGSLSLGRLETQLRASLADALREFWLSGPGAGHVRGAENETLRKLYILAAVCAVTVGVAVLVLNKCSLAGRHLTTTTTTATPLHLREVDFPAVAVCSYNLISRAALAAYARHLNGLDGNRTFSVPQLERQLLSFGALSVMWPATVDASFVGFLAALGQRNVTDIAFRLSPQCSAMLVRCSWRAQVVPCAKLFAARATPLGYCCVFNAHYQAEDAAKPAVRLDVSGRDAALGVVVRQNGDDFAFVRRPIAGVEVMIWDGSEYPIPEGGAVAARSALLNASVFFKLTPRVHRADPVQSTDGERWRGCRTPQPEAAATRTSLAWCLLHCRLDAVRLLCACIPHLYWALYPSESIEVCSLDHLQCLNKYRETLLYYKVDAGAEVLGAGLRCPRCAMDCARTQYAVRVMHSEYHHLHKLFKNQLSSKISLVNTTVIRVYYTTAGQQLLQVETNARWYEIFASLSSQWVMVTGTSVVGALRLLYHVGPRWRHHYLRRGRLHVRQSLMWSQLDKSQ